MKVLWITSGRPHWQSRDVDVDHVEVADFSTDAVVAASAVILSPTAEAEALCRRIRQHPHPLVYLKPLFVLEDALHPLAPEFREAVDGVVPASNLDAAWLFAWRPITEFVRSALGRIPDPTAADTNPGYKAVRWLFTRNRALEPMPTPHRQQGYIYPPAELFVNDSDGTMIEMLSFLESQGVLASDFVDRIFRCGGCKAAFLNVREACCQCKSTHLETDDLVHHFRCGHVAPTADYAHANGMSCPKCERELNMIGVDYDKPSVVYRCLACTHVDQETETLSTCYACGRTVPPDQQESVVIKRFRRNGLTESVALFGLDSLFRRIIESQLAVFPLPVFKRLLQLEIDRVVRFRHSESSLLLLEIAHIERVYRQKPARAQEIFSEVIGILKSILRTTDVVTTLNDAVFVVLLVETPEAGALRAIDRVRAPLDALLGNNLGTEVHARLSQVPIGLGEEPAQVVLDRLLACLDDSGS